MSNQPLRISQTGWLCATWLAVSFLTIMMFMADSRTDSAPRPGQPILLTAAGPAEDPLLKHAPTQDYRIRPFGLISGNGMTRCPVWSLEALTKKHLQGKSRRAGMDFFADNDVPIEFRAHPASYHASGKDQGHGANAANHEHDVEELKSTFTMLNCMPQWPECNRVVILQGEDMQREFAEIDDATTVFRLVAPMWLPEQTSYVDRVKTSRYSFTAIGDDRIWVPTHVGFSILIERAGKYLSIRSWKVPNLERYPKGATFDHYKLSCSDLERDIGLELWKGIPQQSMRDALKKEVHK